MTDLDHDWLDDLLERPAVLEDDGFTERTMARLPPRRPSFALSSAILMGATVLGTVTTVLLVDPSLPELLIDVGTLDFGGGDRPLTALAIIVTLAGTYFGLLAAED